MSLTKRHKSSITFSHLQGPLIIQSYKSMFESAKEAKWGLWNYYLRKAHNKWEGFQRRTLKLKTHNQKRAKIHRKQIHAGKVLLCPRSKPICLMLMKKAFICPPCSLQSKKVAFHVLQYKPPRLEIPKPLILRKVLINYASDVENVIITSSKKNAVTKNK